METLRKRQNQLTLIARRNSNRTLAMLVGTRSSHIANTIGFIKRTRLIRLCLIRTRLTRHWHRRKTWHLRESHTLQSHHCSHRVILIESREPRWHWRETGHTLLELVRMRSNIPSSTVHPVATTDTTTACSGSFERPSTSLRVALLIVLLKPFLESALARVLAIAPSILSQSWSCLWHKSLGCGVVSSRLCKRSSRWSCRRLSWSWLGGSGGGCWRLSLGSVFSKDFVNELDSV